MLQRSIYLFAIVEKTRKTTLDEEKGEESDMEKLFKRKRENK